MTVVAGRRVLITGASSGIGAALAREFGAHECAIFLVARRVERLRQLAEELRANGIEVHYAGCDVAKPDEVAVAARELHRRLGGIDIAVLNAGIIGHVDIQDFRAAGVERTMQRCHSGHFEPGVRARARRFCGILSQQGGVIHVPGEPPCGTQAARYPGTHRRTRLRPH